MEHLLRIAGLTLLLIALCSVSGNAIAQRSKYPDKPIRLIVSSSPGGGTDIIARVMAENLSRAFAQSVVVDNRPGAAGTIGAEIAAKSTPDGYTMIMVSGTYAVTAGLYKLPYDPVNGIDTVSLVGISPFVIALHPSVPAKDVKELIALAKTNPGTINYGSSGTGSITHMATELFRLMSKVDLVHIPYKGMGQALNDLIGGQVQLVFGSIVPILPHARSGRLKAIAVTSLERSDAAPEIPTVNESGLPGYEVTLWYGVWGPKGLPKEVVNRWHAELVKVLHSSDTRSRLATQGLQTVSSTADEFRAALTREIAKWAKVINDANVKVGN